jgi:hypothetical protein
MSKTIFSNKDKIFDAVIHDAELVKIGEYNPEDYPRLQDALYNAEVNPVVKVVAMIINKVSQTNVPDENGIYKSVCDYLNTELI